MENKRKETTKKKIDSWLEHGLTEKFSRLYIILSSVMVFLSFILIIFSIILKTKVFWLFYFFVACSVIYLIALFVMETIKNKERKPTKPKEFPLGTEPFPVKKQVLLFTVGWMGFKLIAVALQILVGGIAAAIKQVSFQKALSTYSVSLIINSLAYIILLTVLLLIAYKDSLKLTKSFKQYQSYIAGVVCVICIFAFNAQYSTFLSVLRTAGILKTPVTNNVNQSSLETLESVFPFTSLIVFGFIGPICEELTYRVGLFSILKRRSRFTAYLVTIIIFALIHFNFSTTGLLNEILNLPYYAFAAVAFSFTYERYGFAGSMSAHIINNVISLVFVSVIH